MRERGDGLRLALEARERVRVVGDGRGQDLDGDVAVELRVARAIDLSHAACSERRQDLVRAESRPRRERQMVVSGRTLAGVMSGSRPPRASSPAARIKESTSPRPMTWLRRYFAAAGSGVREYIPIGCPAGSATRAIAPLSSFRLNGNPGGIVPPSSFAFAQLADMSLT